MGKREYYQLRDELLEKAEQLSDEKTKEDARNAIMKVSKRVEEEVKIRPYLESALYSDFLFLELQDVGTIIQRNINRQKPHQK